MKDQWVQTIVNSYGAPASWNTYLEFVYSRWVDARLSDLGAMGEATKTEIVGELAATKASAVHSMPAQDRHLIAKSDNLIGSLHPIDRSAQQLSRKVKMGEKLSPSQLAQAKEALLALEKIAVEVETLPEDFTQGLPERLSETKLDLIFAIENGKAPRSFRLERAVGQ